MHWNYDQPGNRALSSKTSSLARFLSVADAVKLILLVSPQVRPLQPILSRRDDRRFGPHVVVRE